MGIVQKTIGRMINEVAGAYPNNDALIHTEIGFRYTYDLFLWEIDRTSRGMMRLGIQRGDKVALWAPNIPEWLIVQIAAAKIGAILVPIDPETGIGELEYILSHSDAKAIIMARGVDGDEYVEMISSVKNETPLLEQVVVIATQSFPDMMHWRELAAMGMDVDKG